MQGMYNHLRIYDFAITSIQDHGVRANLKSEALIDLLLDTQYGLKNTLCIYTHVYMWVRTAVTSRRQSPTSKPQPKPPSSRRIVSTRQFSRAATSRISSMIIHDVGDEHTAANKDICAETDGRKPDHGGPSISGPSLPQPQPQIATTDDPRTKAKELQRRLGIGKPIAAGGASSRTVTRSTTLSKGIRLKPSKTAEPEAAIPEEGSYRETRQRVITDHHSRTPARLIPRTYARCLPLLNVKCKND